MTEIGVAELRQDASRWLRRVEQGETIVVTNHGRPVAQLGPITATSGLAAVRARGGITEPVGSHRDLLDEIQPTSGPSLTERVLADRDGRT